MKAIYIFYQPKLICLIIIFCYFVSLCIITGALILDTSKAYFRNIVYKMRNKETSSRNDIQKKGNIFFNALTRN